MSYSSISEMRGRHAEKLAGLACRILLPGVENSERQNRYKEIILEGSSISEVVADIKSHSQNQGKPPPRAGDLIIHNYDMIIDLIRKVTKK